MAPRARTVWRCQQCGASALQWLGRCPECLEYGTFVEEADSPATPSVAARPARSTVPLTEAGVASQDRMRSGLGELDRVLGGGFVPGSLVLIGGEPGIGKSTLLLQASGALAREGRDVLYVCGEESPAQVGLRAARLGISEPRVSLLAEVDTAAVEATVRAQSPDLLVIDSIQTAFDPDLTGSPGSVGQVRAATTRLVRLAKQTGVVTVIVGHMTKDGSIAGPRVLEHMVDCVLYFEGDNDHTFRIVRAAKNRFGSVSEIGIFEMTESGLQGVENPSSMLIGDGGRAVGSSVMAAMEGSRPLLVEVQALVTPSYLQVPRRLATGVDSARLLQVVGVLERRGGVDFAGHDVYVSIAGGVRILEPAIDLPLALALVSARKDRPLKLGLAAFGEIGLTGRIRTVVREDARCREAERQGLTPVTAVPSASGAGQCGPGVVTLESVADVAALLQGG